MRYYELDDDVTIKGRWYLNGLLDNQGRELDSRDFTYSRRLATDGCLQVTLNNEGRMIKVEQPLKVRLRRKGLPLDISFADFDMPVVTRAVGNLLNDIAPADIQRFPVQIDSCKEEYDILNIISRPNCIDISRSKIDEWWTEEDQRPDLLGQPQMISKLRIDENRTAGAHIFRPDGWDVVVIVSDVVKKALQRERATGVKFRKV